jgi:NitT/TauT family transport system substrate-binding protein
VPSFVAGTGDYCTMFEPTASQCELDGTGKIVSALGEEIGNIPYTVFTSTSSFLNKNPEKIEKFMRALKKGYDYLMIATDLQLITALKPSFTTTSDELIVSAVRNYIRIGAYADDFVSSQNSWTMLQTIMTHAGELEGTVAYNDAVNTSFASALNK